MSFSSQPLLLLYLETVRFPSSLSLIWSLFPASFRLVYCSLPLVFLFFADPSLFYYVSSLFSPTALPLVLSPSPLPLLSYPNQILPCCGLSHSLPSPTQSHSHYSLSPRLPTFLLLLNLFISGLHLFTIWRDFGRSRTVYKIKTFRETIKDRNTSKDKKKISGHNSLE